jgi:hypothetical protein
MAIPAYIDDDLAVQLGKARTQLITDLAAGINAIQRAATALERLRSNYLYDVELVEGRDGRDIASLVDDSIRYGRAAYAVVQHDHRQGEGLMGTASCHRDVGPHRIQPSEGPAPRSDLDRTRNTDGVDREMQCDAVFRALDKEGIEYQKIDISTDPEAREYVMALGYLFF